MTTSRKKKRNPLPELPAKCRWRRIRTTHRCYFCERLAHWCFLCGSGVKHCEACVIDGLRENPQYLERVGDYWKRIQAEIKHTLSRTKD